jgi:hypothetical protein
VAQQPVPGDGGVGPDWEHAACGVVASVVVTVVLFVLFSWAFQRRLIYLQATGACRRRQPCWRVRATYSARRVTNCGWGRDRSRRAARPVRSRFWLPMATPVAAVEGVAGAEPGRRAGGPLHGGAADEGARLQGARPGRAQLQPEQAGRVVGGRLQLTCRPEPGSSTWRSSSRPSASGVQPCSAGTQLDRGFTFGRCVHDRKANYCPRSVAK